MSAWGVQESTLDIDSVVGDATLDESEKSHKLQHQLVEFSQNGQSQGVHELLGHNAAAQLLDVNAQDQSGSTALIYASCYGHENVVSELLRFNANPDIQDGNEWTALMWAINNHHLAIVQSLLQNGANAEIKTSNGRSAADFTSPGDLIYSFLHSNGYIKEAEPFDFYKQAQDPAEMEEQFARQIEESTQALGLKVADMSIDEDEAVGFGQQAWEPNSEVEFNWTHYSADQVFVVDPESIPQFLDLVISNVRPSLQKNQAPVSANALFLAVRYFQFQGPEDALISLIFPVSRRITTVVDENSADLTYLCYWLANTSILVYYLERDAQGLEKSGPTADFLSTLKELEHSLANKVVFCVENLLDPLLKPCLLDFKNIPELSEVQFRSEWRIFQRKNKPSVDAETAAAQGMLPPSMKARMRPAPSRVTAVLSSLLVILDLYKLHPVITQQLFSQIFYWMGGTLFNSIMENKHYLARTRAMQIRLNISAIEDWSRANNRVPDDGDEFSKTRTYKSMVELCRTHLGSLAQILQWLQCFSGFGSDFTTVVATMQELTHLNPKQLLYSAKKYRVEVNEPELSKEYRQYLAELATHYEHREKEEPAKVETSILLSAPSITSQDIFLDINLWLPFKVPAMREMIVFWGGGIGGADTSSPSYLVPSVPVEIADTLDSVVKNDAFKSFKEPASSLQPQWQDDEWQDNNGVWS